MNTLIFVLCSEFILFYNLAISQAQLPDETCQLKTLPFKNGTCVPIQNCTSLLDILQSPTLSSWDRHFLQSTQCGFRDRTPLVCCPEKVTEFDLVGGFCGRDIRDEFSPDILNFRWSALIEYNTTDPTDKFLCGGSLISRNFILTAAHCVEGQRFLQEHLSAVSVRIGEYCIQAEVDCFEGNTNTECGDSVVDMPIAEVIVHEEYDTSSKSQSNDIALIRLERPVNFTDFIRPICLPLASHLKDDETDGAKYLVFGFGRITNGNASDCKMLANVDGISLNECSNLIGSTDIPINEQQFCAKGANTCLGDSGGPLTRRAFNGKDSYEYLAGIMSQEPMNCGDPDSFATFTRVDKYVDWILNHAST